MFPPHEWVPIVNFVLLVFCLVCVVLIFLRSHHWSAPSQHIRLSSLEKTQERHAQRLTQLEENNHRLGVELDHGIEHICDEIRRVADKMTDLEMRCRGSK